MDWNNDGKKDLLLGEYAGYVRVYINAGPDSAPLFNTYTYLNVGTNIFDCGDRSVPDIVDWNNDGKKDIVCGEYDGYLNLLLNTGTDASPSFDTSTLVQNSGGNLRVSGNAAPDVYDWDGDGKKDLLVGETGGRIRFYQNVGTDAAPVFDGYTCLQAGGTTLDAGSYPLQEVVDWNNDGRLDVIVGNYDGRVCLYRAEPPVPFTFRAIALTNTVFLRWSDPVASGMSNQTVHIRCRTDDYPTHTTDGTAVYTGTDLLYEHTTNCTAYVTNFYTIWVSHDGATFVDPP
ncbi:MAG: VCBS repeat-containing protein [Kiritimatiellae bacterium]|nr:VCBS repeat-containing protein [Kiritimatiellia bacterium]